MNSKIILAFCIVITIAAAVPAQTGFGGWPPAGGVNPWIPPWVSAAPWYPQWSPCTTIGSSCVDCSTKIVCTKIGAIQRACSDPTMPHCNLGECSATPSEECAVPVVPANTA
ncbi:uncharacterized protein LOC124536871 [Vanessa cardui]|uniref:uncharacterized protein LOC124536871 n=1 Tax=Vanessa cardui TaxID=171605 RepID=UPI001F13AA65|nr:uncharacterized protein LOC124536871 [Vanessa cardui]